MTKRSVIAILAAVFSVGISVAQGPATIEPGSVYQVAGVTVTSPHQAGWELLRSDEREVVFRKKDSDRTCLSWVAVIKPEPVPEGSDLLAALEARKTEELKTHGKVDSLHFNRIRGKAGPSLQYDGIFKIMGPAGTSSGYLNFRGRLCPALGQGGTVVEIGFSESSKTRGFSEDLLALADQFIEGIG